MSDEEPEDPDRDPRKYRVGYGKPPLATRFRPGQSGNPRGRPKGAKNLASVLSATLSERVTVTENGRRRSITKLQAAVKQLVNRAAGGEARALQLLLAVVQASEARPPQADPAHPTDADELVMRDLVRRLKGESNG